MGKTSYKASETSDASLEATLKSAGIQFSLALLDPLVGGDLVREAYAFKGPVLEKFANELQVSPEELAINIIEHMPARPTRKQLRLTLHYAAPHLSRYSQ